MGATIVGVGRLGRDPEMQYTPQGTALTHFNVAVKSGFGDKEVTTWFSLSVFGKQAEACKQYLDKGSRVKFVGEIVEAKTYESKNGTKVDIKVKVFDVEFLDGAKKRDESELPEDF